MVMALLQCRMRRLQHTQARCFALWPCSQVPGRLKGTAAGSSSMHTRLNEPLAVQRTWVAAFILSSASTARESTAQHISRARQGAVH